MVQNLPVLLIIIPLLSAILIPLFGRFHKRCGWSIATAATAATFLISLSLLQTVFRTGRISYWLGNWEPPWGIEYAVDELNGFVLVVVSFLAFVLSIYSKRSVEREISEDKATFFYALYMLLVTGLLGIVVTGDIFNLYVFLEIASLSGYVLIAMGKKRDALMASYNYLILGTIAATFILLGIGHLYMATGSLNMADLRERVPPLYGSTVVRTALGFFAVGLSIKLAVLPLHVWLPNAYTHAPSVVSALMAATATKVSAYALIRIFFTVFRPEFILTIMPVTPLLLAASSLAMVAGPLLALAQTDIRRMLAYSSVGQIGYIVLGIALANRSGIMGGLLHILNHAVMKGGLFLVVGAVVYKTGFTSIGDLRGMGRRMPLSMAAFTIGALSLIGVPLTVGFVSKWYLAIGALQAGKWFMIPVILFSSLLTAMYFWRVIETIYSQAPASSVSGVEVSREMTDEAPAGMLLPILLLAVLCLVLGIFAFPAVSITDRAAAMLLGVR